MLEIQSLLVLRTELINLQCLKWLNKTCVNWNVALTKNTNNKTTYSFTAFFLCDDFCHYSLVIFVEKHLDVVDQGTRRIGSLTMPVGNTVLPMYLPNDVKHQKQFLFSPS